MPTTNSIRTFPLSIIQVLLVFDEFLIDDLFSVLLVGVRGYAIE